MVHHPDPISTGRRFVEETFPDALVAIVGGSMVRGEGTPTSDLDLLIVVGREEAPFRASYLAHGWPIEAFVHTPESWRWYFSTDVARARPSLVSMCEEGVVVCDVGDLANTMKAEARRLLDQGPDPLTPDVLDDLRYALTDLLDDFLGCGDRTEGFFIAAAMAESAVELRLRRAGRWIGTGKWTQRALRRADPDGADALSDALEAYARHDNRAPLAAFVRDTLEDAGGRLFEGYHRAGRREPPEMNA